MKASRRPSTEGASGLRGLQPGRTKHVRRSASCSSCCYTRTQGARPALEPLRGRPSGGAACPRGYPTGGRKREVNSIDDRGVKDAHGRVTVASGTWVLRRRRGIRGGMPTRRSPPVQPTPTRRSCYVESCQEVSRRYGNNGNNNGEESNSETTERRACFLPD